MIATGEEHSVREFVEIAFERAGLDPEKHVVARPALPPPGRGRPPGRRRLEGRGASSVVAADSASASWSELMVDADLERVARSLPAAQPDS